MSKYTTRGEAIKDLRKNAGLSQEELAKMLNTTKQTIYKYETGIVTNIPSDKIESMSRIFGVSPAVIMGWDDNPASPLYEAAAGPGRLNDGYPTEEISIHLEADETIVRVNGRSMEPTLQDGDRVIVSATSIVDDISQIALVQVDGEEYTLKHVQVDDDGLTLIADNVSVYTPRRFTAKQVEELPVRILGVVKVLIRNFQ